MLVATGVRIYTDRTETGLSRPFSPSGSTCTSTTMVSGAHACRWAKGGGRVWGHSQAAPAWHRLGRLFLTACGAPGRFVESPVGGSGSGEKPKARRLRWEVGRGVESGPDGREIRT